MPFLVNGAPQSMALPVIVSEHYAGCVDCAGNLDGTLCDGLKASAASYGKAWAKSPSNYDAGANCPGIAPWSNRPGPRWVLH